MLKLKADSILKILFVGWILAGFSASAFAQIRQASNLCNATNPGPQSASLAEAMKISAHDIDPSLPTQCVADWLMTVLGTNSFSWSLADCEKPVNGSAPADNDAPKCFVAEGNTLNIAKLRVVIQVGTATNLISGRPTFHAGSVSGCGRSRGIAALSDLKDAIQYINAACAKQ